MIVPKQSVMIVRTPRVMIVPTLCVGMRPVTLRVIPGTGAERP